MTRMVRVLMGVLVALSLGAVACSGGGDDDAASSDTDEGSEFAAQGEATEEAGVDDFTGAQVGTEEATEEATESPIAEEAAEEEAPAGVNLASSEDALPGTADVPIGVQPEDLGRDIIRTADIVIEADDVAAATQDAIGAVAAAGGFLFDQRATTDPARAIITFKIEPRQFDAARSALSAVGRLVSEAVTAEDVTAVVVDLESRIASQEISVERLRALLADATSLDGVARLEAELLQRETTLEQLRGQLRTVQDRVALATIVLRINETAPEALDVEIDGERFAVAGQLDHDRCVDAANAADEIDEGDEVTVCYVIENTGETPLGELEIRDSRFDIELDELILVDGDPDRIEPGGAVVLAFETDLDRTVQGSAEVAATPLDEAGDPSGDRTGADFGSAISVRADSDVPGFVEALKGSWGALKALGRLALAVVGAVLPFLWLALLPLGWFWWRRRRGSTPAAADAKTDVAAG